MTRSSAEAKFRGLAHDLCELLWITNILKDMSFKFQKPRVLHCDNETPIEISHNPVQHNRTKHVEVDRHFF